MVESSLCAKFKFDWTALFYGDITGIQTIYISWVQSEGRQSLSYPDCCLSNAARSNCRQSRAPDWNVPPDLFAVQELGESYDRLLQCCQGGGGGDGGWGTPSTVRSGWRFERRFCVQLMHVGFHVDFKSQNFQYFPSQSTNKQQKKLLTPEFDLKLPY